MIRNGDALQVFLTSAALVGMRPRALRREEDDVHQRTIVGSCSGALRRGCTGHDFLQRQHPQHADITRVEAGAARDGDHVA